VVARVVVEPLGVCLFEEMDAISTAFAVAAWGALIRVGLLILSFPVRFRRRETPLSIPLGVRRIVLYPDVTSFEKFLVGGCRGCDGKCDSKLTVSEFGGLLR
jgi:hypothetical protein